MIISIKNITDNKDCDKTQEELSRWRITFVKIINNIDGDQK